MLKKDVLKSNTVLAALTDEQIAAIETLSANDEAVVIGQKTGEIYREMDTKILNITGVTRDGDEKTYNYFERAMKGIKEKALEVDTLKKSFDDISKEKTRLEKVISDGNVDVEIKKAYEQNKKDLAAITKQFTDLKADYDKAVETHTGELASIKIDNALSLATSSIKFKSDLPQAVTNVLLDQTLGKLKSMKPEFIDDGNGGKMLAFKDDTGAIMRNPENKLNPYSANDLLAKELKALGVLDEGKVKAGGGTGNPSGGNGGTGIVVDITGAKTRVEANQIATKMLMDKGLTQGSEEFDKQMTEIWRENKVSELPES